MTTERYNAPSNRGIVNWDNLDYNDPTWGWLYKQLWYISHPNSSEQPPWLNPVPISDAIPFMLLLSGIFAIKIWSRQKKVVPLQQI